MSRRNEFKNASSKARYIWGTHGPTAIAKARSSPVVSFRNQANIALFKQVLGGGMQSPAAQTNAPNGRRLKFGTNYVLMRSFQPFHPYKVNLKFPLNRGYYAHNSIGLANKANVNRVIQNLSRIQLNAEMKSKNTKRHIAAAKVAQILGNAIERRRKLKNNILVQYGLMKARKYNSPARKQQANGQRIATARRRASIMARH